MARIDLAERLSSTRARVDAEPAPVVDGPLFARLARKEVRVRDDQLMDLATVSKRLMRARAVRVERITDNTLIRVAIDLLLTHQADLSGSTEAELLDSVTSGLRHSRSSAQPNLRTGVREFETPAAGDAGAAGNGRRGR